METIKINKLQNEKKIGVRGYSGKLMFVLPSSDIGCFYAVSIFNNKPRTKKHIWGTFDTYESAKIYYKRWISKLDAWANTLQD